MLKDYISYSIRNVRKRRLRSWLTMIGIFIGIAAIVALIGLGQGLRTAITSQFGFLGSDVLSIQAQGLAFAGPPGAASVNPLDEKLADKIEKVRGVDTAFNRRIESGLMEFNDKQSVIMIGSVPSGTDRKVFEMMVNLQPEQGRLLKEGDSKKVFLGNNFASDTTFGKGIKSGDRVIISGNTFEVVGILKKKGSFIFDSVALLNDQTMDELFGNEETIDVIAVKVKDASMINEIKGDIEKMMRKERNVKEGEEDFTVDSPQQILDTLDSTLFAVQLFIYIIASISLVVGGIGITNTMYTSVLERTKEIGVMKSIGAKNSVIFTLFAIESGYLGLIGGLIGIALGLSMAYGFAFVGQLFLGEGLIKAEVSIFLIIGALLFSFIVGTAAGLMPALQASKMQPVDALRFAK